MNLSRSVFQPPPLMPEDVAVLGLIQELYQRLEHRLRHAPEAWGGRLQRETLARALRGSVGIRAPAPSLDDALAAVDDDEPVSVATPGWRALSGCRDAMAYVPLLAEEGRAAFHGEAIRALHFMLLRHDPAALPGRWRTGGLQVVNPVTGKRVHQAPDAIEVPALMNRLIAGLNLPDETPAPVKAAMAHLNLAMIHPFQAGNGRMARALHALVLARCGTSPAFAAIDEWLHENAAACYAMLGYTGAGGWNPGNSALGWVRLCLRAQYQHGQALLRRMDRYERAHGEIARLVRARGLHARTTGALLDGAMGFRVRAGQYRKEHGLSEVVASRDLRRLCEEGLLLAHGERRGRHYSGAPALRATAGPDPGMAAPDPYVLVRGQAEEAAPRAE
jgi:Fic family protein